MIRMTRLTDYAIVLLSHFARRTDDGARSARDLAGSSRLPVSTVSKVCKTLARHGLLEARRGPKGGFRLARRPEQISVAEILDALEGPLGITECSAHPGNCGLERLCPVGSNWRRINAAVRSALQGITLAEMTHPLSLPVRGPGRAEARAALRKPS